ncbi:helix-turn-helix transcriptional regulator [Entomohabitans teleogrylli]|uniref:helix-turn-helix transcriptional regulator n=1 Tax=Entomohabitans teleogrylli TaxID=1384589 RepID=UPI00073D3145|nr:AraC family transcriptional regulator [Entomohabitans teleogrylli]
MLKRFFSTDDFIHFGERYGIDYRFPALSSCRASGSEKHIVMQGDVEEMTLASGISLTRSDVRVLQPYESTSLHSCPLYMLVVLEGCVMLSLNGQEYVVRSGMAFCSQLGERQIMNARHQADCRLKTLSLGVGLGDGCQDEILALLLQQWQASGAPTFLWPVPGYLLCGLDSFRHRSGPPLARQMILEGVMLQLLGHCLTLRQQQQVGRAQAASGERRRLENIRRLLEQQPEKDYTLNELAQLAAMSSSSLRSKFRHAYGHSVFDYLRDCRLELARRYLTQGYSVQQAAWMSGYQHATNFSTAFRRRYGIAPSDVRAAC